MMGPRHYSIDVRLHLKATYGQQWIGRGGSVLWPARLPDLNCLDYFLWGGWKETLLEDIDPDDLPAYLGGNRRDPDGNPLCETFVSIQLHS
ncbi:hypothetical protein AVEN_176251-1 [Araneus ventricosus]|uniref:CRAL-TRIO domain-containing protein n=1 Tax=Araneus ventricosus TaxID=182803 RepID=A0A4Y2VC47_ARAVE|nr:hypothetical protein AVEN_147526-1 [Araneus ventricosus]GBO22861.1 hypothetical protein AVEN_148475-1 [Araneus ventricosus]GBO22882.1 hypothetical protein AVEN_176251-1 [Araneus ventricosus]